MKIAVLGAAGLLGRHVVEELRGHEVRGFDRRTCDVSKLADVERAVEGVELVINCAGFTAVDPAETRIDEAYQANAIGAENLARAALRAGCKAMHVSTDFVFDGAQAHPYDEFDEPRPISAYGRSKWAGEKLFKQVGGKLFLVRVQGLYGAGGPNFSSKLRDLIKADKRLTLDAERRVQPTWARSAARQIVVLAATEHYGTYHVSSHGEATWATFAKLVAESLGVAPAWDEVPTAALKAPAARPPNCQFAHRMLSLRGLDRLPNWQVAAEEYLAEEAAKDARERA